jgi:LPS sulfotransferase NodH
MPPRIPRKTAVELMNRVIAANVPPEQLARELGLTLEQMAQWISQPRNLNTVTSLVRLANLRTDLILSRFRANAVAHLVGIAGSAEPNELSRKACVDLLNAQMQEWIANAPSGREPPSPPAPSERAILKALEEIGRDA